MVLIFFCCYYMEVHQLWESQSSWIIRKSSCITSFLLGRFKSAGNLCFFRFITYENCFSLERYWRNYVFIGNFLCNLDVEIRYGRLTHLIQNLIYSNVILEIGIFGGWTIFQFDWFCVGVPYMPVGAYRVSL